MSLIQDPVTFLRSLESFQSCPPILFVQAADFIRPQRFVTAVIGKLGKALIKRVDGRGLNTAEGVRSLVGAINSRSLLASCQVIVLSNAEAVPAEMQRRIVKSGVPPDFVRLVILSRQTAQSSLLKWADESGGLVKFPELKEATLMRWIERELKFQGVSAWEEQAVQGLAQAEDLDHLAGIIQSIGLYLDGEKLTKKILKDFLVTDSEASDFELLDLITTGGGKAQLLLAQMMREGKNEFALLAFLQRSFAMLFRVKSYLERGVDQGTMRTELALSPWLLSKYISQTSRYSLSQLRRASDALLAAEGKLKNRSLGAELVLDEALVFLKVGNG